MGILSKLFGAKEKAPEITEDIRPFTGILDHGGGVNDFYIAGLAHHCSRKDVGLFTGTVFNEKDNAYDRKAMAIGNTQTKTIVGYVPSAILDSYRSWCGKKSCPCIGFVFFDGEALRGRVRAYLTDCGQEDIMKDIADYARQVCEHFGWPVPDFSAE